MEPDIGDYITMATIIGGMVLIFRERRLYRLAMKRESHSDPSIGQTP